MGYARDLVEISKGQVEAGKFNGDVKAIALSIIDYSFFGVETRAEIRKEIML